MANKQELLNRITELAGEDISNKYKSLAVDKLENKVKELEMVAGKAAANIPSGNGITELDIDALIEKKMNAMAKTPIQADNTDSIVKQLTQALLGAAGMSNTGATGVQDASQKVLSEVKRRVNARDREMTKRVERMVSKENLVKFKIPKIYKNYIGTHLKITVNTGTITMPVDGRSYYIPKAHAARAGTKLAKLDDKIARNSNENTDGTQGDFLQVKL